MKHVMFPSAWRWDTEKFPRYFAELIYGRHRHDSAMLPVMGGLAPEEKENLKGFNPRARVGRDKTRLHR